MNRIGLFVIFIVAFISNSFAQETANNVIWEPTFKEALEKAKNEQKPILIYFTGSDWCGPCIQLDKELFHTEKFETFAKEKMVVYMADFPRNRDLITSDARKINKELSKKYKQTSFPTMVVIDAKGNVLGQKNGKYMAEYYYPFFEEVVRAFE